MRPGGAAPRTGCGARSSGTTASTGCAASSATGFDAEMDRRILVMAGDVGVDGLGLDAAGEDAPGLLLDGDPLGGHRQLRLAARHRGRDQPARPDPGGGDPPTGCTPPAAPSSPTSSPCRRPTWPAAGGAGAGGHPARHALVDRRRLATRGGRGPPGPGRRRRRQPRPEDAGPLPAPGPRRAGRGGHPAAGRQVRTTPRGLGQGPPGRGRARPGPKASAGPTPTPTPRPWASGPCSRPGATCRSPSCARRSSSRPWPSPYPGWIRGFRMADPVIISYGKGLLKEFPGVPEGDHRRHPGRPGGGRHPGRGGPRPARRARRVPRRVGGPQPAPLPPAGRPGAGAGSSSTRWPTARTSRSPCPSGRFPGRSRVQRQLRQATQALGRGRAGPADPAAAGPPGRAGAPASRSGGTRPSGPCPTSSCTAPTPRPRPSSRWTGCSSCSPRLPAEDQRDFCFDPAVIDWPHFCHDVYLPSVVAHARVRLAPRPAGGRPEPASGADRADPGGAGSPGRPRPRAPAGRVRPGEHPHRLQRRRLLRLAGHPPPGRRRPGPVRAADPAGGPPAAGPGPRRPRRLPALLLPPLRRGARWSGCASDSWELFSDLVLTKSFPAGIRRVREHRALGHKTLLITGALDVVIEPLRPLFDEVVCARLGEKSGRFTGELVEAPPTGRGPGPDHGRLRPSQRPRPRAERGLRRLGQRPAHAGGGRPSGGGQPRDQAGGHRPQAGLARRALAEGPRRAPAPAADRAPAA